PGREEYLDSEKDQAKARGWDKPGNIKDYIAQLNRLRRANTALQQTSNLRFAQLDHDGVIGFVKESGAGGNAGARRSALDAGTREFWFHFGEIEIGLAGGRRRVREIENLKTGERRLIEWGGVRLRIEPEQDPALLFRCWA